MFTTVSQSREHQLVEERADQTGTVDRAARPRRLTATEEATLSRAWRDERDQTARDRLVTANLGLVVSIAQRYRNAGVPLEELIAEGNVGLLSAVDGFNPDCGSRFSTYAAYWIRQGIGRAFAASTPRGRLNGRDRHDLAALERVARTFYARTGIEPTHKDLAGELGWTLERIGFFKSIHASHARPCSLDGSRDAGFSRAAQLSVHGTQATDDPQSTVGAVESLLNILSPFERSAIELRFGLHGAEPHSVDAIASALDRTRAETRAALRMAMAKLSRSGRGRTASDASRSSSSSESSRSEMQFTPRSQNAQTLNT